MAPSIVTGPEETVGWRGEGNDNGARRTSLRPAALRKACSVRLKRFTQTVESVERLCICDQRVATQSLTQVGGSRLST